jgi:hypothetical protein
MLRYITPRLFELKTDQLSCIRQANKMVATERRRAASLDEELSNVSEEKEALRGALRVVESENAKLRDTCREMRGIFERERRVDCIPLPESPPETSVVRTLMGNDMSSTRSKPQTSTAASTSSKSTPERRGSASSVKAMRAVSPPPSTISRKSSAASIASTASQSRAQRQNRTLTIDVDLSQSASHFGVGRTEIDNSATPQAGSTTHPRPPGPVPIAAGSRLSAIPPPASIAEMNLPTPVGVVHQVPNRPPPQPHERSRSGSDASVRSTTPSVSQTGQPSRRGNDLNGTSYLSALSRGGSSLGA